MISIWVLFLMYYAKDIEGKISVLLIGCLLCGRGNPRLLLFYGSWCFRNGKERSGKIDPVFLEVTFFEASVYLNDFVGSTEIKKENVKAFVKSIVFRCQVFIEIYFCYLSLELSHCQIVHLRERKIRYVFANMYEHLSLLCFHYFFLLLRCLPRLWITIPISFVRETCETNFENMFNSIKECVGISEVKAIRNQYYQQLS